MKKMKDSSASKAKPRFTQKTKPKCIQDKQFREWIKEYHGETSKVYCNFCHCTVIAKQGDLIAHSKTKKHIKLKSEERKKEKNDVNLCTYLKRGRCSTVKYDSYQIGSLDLNLQFNPSTISPEEEESKLLPVPQQLPVVKTNRNGQLRNGDTSHHASLASPNSLLRFRDFDSDMLDEHTPPLSSPEESPSKLFDQHFGTCLWPENGKIGTSSVYLRSSRPPREKSGISQVNNIKDKFSVVLEVPHFLPEEIDIRVTEKVLEVEGKHKERQDEHGCVVRHFTRKYVLPENVLIDMMSSSLAADGVLTIEAPKKDLPTTRLTQRKIPIRKSKNGINNL